MKRRNRWLIGIVSALLVLLLALALSLPVLLGSVYVKTRVARELRAFTGLELSIDGDLKWQLWPVLVVSIGESRLVQPGGHGTPLARWKEIAVMAHWRPLLHGAIGIDGVRMDELRLSLRRDAGGAIAWPELPGTDGGSARSVMLGRFELVDASIGIEGSGSTPALQIVALQMGTGFDLDAAGVVMLRDFTLDAVAHAATLPSAGLPFALSAAKLVLQPDPLQIEPTVIEARLAGFDASVQLDTPVDPAGPSASGRLQLSTPSLRASAAALGIELPPTHDAQVFGVFESDTTWRLDAEGLALDPLRATLDGQTFAGKGSVPFSGDAPARFTLAGDRMDLDRYVRPENQPGEPFVLPVEALRALHVEGELRLNEARLLGNTLRGVRLRAGDHADTPLP
jgi:AsmA protein